MPEIPFTEEQRRAIQTVGRDVIVSAAAGAGKTAVLAERCAFLVCDAPPPHRCDADALLVLTFTEAAAAEMRERIVEAIRRRSHGRPADPRFHEQAARVGAAQISTIHSFCLTLIRRWFSELDVDPAATVMDEHESRLLRRETLDRLFTRLYERARVAEPPHDPPDVSRAGKGNADSPFGGPAEGGGRSTPLWLSFSALVDDYGLGDDRAIGEFVLSVHAHSRSLPDPESWLAEAADFGDRRMGDVVRRFASAALEELELQHEHLASLLADRRATPAFEPRVLQPADSYRHVVEDWRDTLRSALNGPDHGLMNVFDGLVQRTAEFQFPRAASRRKADPPDVLTALDIAKGELGSLRDWFRKRLRNRFLRFRWSELLRDARRTAPHVRAVVDLVSSFERDYADRKRALGLLDFADLEQMAYRLLHGTDASGGANAAVVSLRRRFAHVLVDEFQDINPLQLAIIRLASRDEADRGGGNLFLVGDVKQSIYRFRLAEPALFVDWSRRLGASPNRGAALGLRTNFRSRSAVIDAVNAVFRVLMAHSDMPYDEAAELRCGRVVADDARRAPVEIHVLNSGWPAGSRNAQPKSDREGNRDDAAGSDGEADTEGADANGDDACGAIDAGGPGRWTREEREAFVIASRIQAWRATGEPVVEGRAPRPDEIAVLLRSPRYAAERMAAMLRRMGVPAVAEAGASLLSTVEVRDVLSALRLLDNAAQDIPLASVLRSGVLGERLTPQELARIRIADRQSPFHDAALTYARRGDDDALRGRLSVFFRRVDQWRDAARRRPLSETIGRLLDEHGHLARAGASSHGAQRRANLLSLHELARAFGEFRRQGLRRFLEFIDSLVREDREIDVGSTGGDVHGTVRIMSIHKAKGLEFPVVFLAGLGRVFNQEDVRGRMLFERRSKIGLRVVDPANLIEHPSVLHRLAVAETEQCARDEEMRVLYVGMTRARDRLVMLGSAASKDQAHAAPRRSTRLDLMTATSPMDWLQAVLANAPAGVSAAASVDPASSAARGNDSRQHGAFHVFHHTSADMDAWRLPRDSGGDSDELLRAASRFEPLPPGEPVAIESAEVRDVFDRLDHVYPHLSVSSVPATIAASAFTGAQDPARAEAASLIRFEETGEFHWSPRSRRDEAATPLDAAGAGIAAHKALQHLDLTTPPSAVASELQRLVGEAKLSEREALAVDTDSIAWFLGTDLARRMRDAGSDYRRETMFIASESLTALDVAVEPDLGDFVLVRGIVDGILPTPDGLEVIDFKTDRVDAGEVAARTERYAPQLRLYARAVARLWSRPVTRCTLVFLTARRFATVEI